MQPRHRLPGYLGRWKWWQAIVSFLRLPSAERPVRRPDQITRLSQQSSGAVATQSDGPSARHRANSRDGIAPEIPMYPNTMSSQPTHSAATTTTPMRVPVPVAVASSAKRIPCSATIDALSLSQDPPGHAAASSVTSPHRAMEMVARYRLIPSVTCGRTSRTASRPDYASISTIFRGRWHPCRRAVGAP